MSADNGTYILQTTGSDGPEFRIVHCQAIDNIYGQYIESTGRYLPNSEMIVEYFGKSVVYTDLETAWDEAFRIEEQKDWSEDGACLIPDFTDYNFEDFVEQSKHT